MKRSWLLPTYINKVPYSRIRDVNFSSAKKLKENLDKKIDSLNENRFVLAGKHCNQRERPIKASCSAPTPTKQEMADLFKKLNNCSTKAVCLSLNLDYAKQFVAESRNVPVVTDLFKTDYLDIGYLELLRLSFDVRLTISDDEIRQVERDSRAQAKCSTFFWHRAGRIGASLSGTVFHCDITEYKSY